MKSMFYFIIGLSLIGVVNALYCYPYGVDNDKIRNITGECYMNGTSICVPPYLVDNDYMCEVYYDGFVDSIYKPDGLCKGRISRNLTLATSTVFFKVERGTKIRYVDREVVNVVTKEKPVEVIKEVEKIVYVEATQTCAPISAEDLNSYIPTNIALWTLASVVLAITFLYVIVDYRNRGSEI